MFATLPGDSHQKRTVFLHGPWASREGGIATQLTLNISHASLDMGRVLLRDRVLGTYVPIGNFPCVSHTEERHA